MLKNFAKPKCFGLLFCLILLFLWSGNRSVIAAFQEEANGFDTIFLSSGAELKGRIVSDSRETGRRVVTVELESGGTIAIDRALLISRVRKFDDIDREYQRLIEDAQADNDSTAETYWGIYQWCETHPAGKNRFRNERQFLLEKVIQLNPNDDKARRELGYRKFGDGRWYLEKAWYDAYGYRPKGTSWQSSLESEYGQQLAAAREQKQLRHRELNRWFDRASRPQANFQMAQAELMQMINSDPWTIPAMFEWLKDDAKKASPLRAIYMEGFGIAPPDFLKVGALGYFAVQDPDESIRERALTLLLQPSFSSELTAAMLAGYLRAENTDVAKTETILMMERAAYIIGELGATNQILTLINALETEGVVVVNPNAGRMGVGNVDGNINFAPPANPVKSKKKHYSDPVLNALKKITGKDFGFNIPAWKAWYIANHTANDRTLRTDD